MRSFALKKRVNSVKYVFVFLLYFIFVGCAQQKSSGLDQDAGIEGQGDEMDMLLSDDFFDDEFVLEEVYYDPLEPMNRVIFEFNDKLYYWVLKPLNTAYSAVLPFDIRYVLGNFFNNLNSPIRLINNLLQGKINDAGVELSRFLINSTIGVYGFTDPALTEFGLEQKQEDFGQTLGAWGIGEGVYICWPILGPSNIRDSFGFGADLYTYPLVYFVDDTWTSVGFYAFEIVNLRSLTPELYEDMKKYSLDPYVSMRQVYLDYRRNEINK